MTENEATTDQNDKSTWRNDTQKFKDSSPEVGEAHAPQLRALFAIADALDRADAAGEPPSMALVSEYARLHRWMVNKVTGGRRDPDDEPPAGPSLFEQLGGKWATT